MIKGSREPLISDPLFYEVQKVINTKRQVVSERDDLKEMFYLRGVLVCPLCSKKLRGSFSRGSTKRYPYYHCDSGCKTRINARIVNASYEQELNQLELSKGAMDLFKYILEDWNTGTQKAVYRQHRNVVVRKMTEQESIISQGRKLFIAGILEADDYSALKRESHVNFKCLKRELNDIDAKLKHIDEQSQLGSQSIVHILKQFLNLDVADKKHLVSLIPPSHIDSETGDVSLGLIGGLAKIVSTKRQSKK